MKRFYRFELALLFVGVASVGYFAAVRKGIDLLDWIGFGEEISVQTTPAKMESRMAVMSLSGELQPIREADVVSRLAGKLSGLRFGVGDRVEAGAVVATVSSADLAERAGDAEAGLNAARAEAKDKEGQLAEMEKRRDKIRELFRQDLIARRDLEVAEQAVITGRLQAELAGARLAQQEAMLAQVQKLRGLTSLTAPMTGVVIRQPLGPGASVNESRVILTIAQLNTLKLIAELPENISGRVRPGMAVQVVGRQWRDSLRDGKITRVESKEVEGQQIVRVESQFANRDQVFDPGVLVEAKVSLPEREKVLLIPRAALQRQARSFYVYKIADGRAWRQEVRVDDTEEESVVVRKGLKEGDLVVLNQFDAVKEGIRVRPMIAQKPAPVANN